MAHLRTEWATTVLSFSFKLTVCSNLVTLLQQNNNTSVFTVAVDVISLAHIDEHHCRNG